jgi:hypothetical protein
MPTSSEQKAAAMPQTMSEASDQPTTAPASTGRSSADKAADKPGEMTQSSGVPDKGPGTASFSETKTETEANGLPAGSNAKSGRGSDGPL